MNPITYLQLAFYLLLLLLLVKPLGGYMAKVYQNQPLWLGRFGGPVERLIYVPAGINPTVEMNWQTYALSLLLFNGLGAIILYLWQRLQFLLPLNPAQLPAVSPDLAFNTAISFVSNTNWQSYSGETTMSYLTQMVGLTVQNFLSAATGMAVLVALTRALVRRSAQTIGNFWVDLTRTVLYILLPLAVIWALLLVSQGVVQTLRPYQTLPLLQATPTSDPTSPTSQTIALGPAASQIAIKQLGTNGGGFFNTNSAHPLENPTPLSNFLELLAILLIPAALCYTFGEMVGDTRQGWALLLAMALIFVPLLIGVVGIEQSSNPLLTHLSVDQQPSNSQAGGNMEGKETRFGIAASALWAAATTAASNGSVNSMHDSYLPLSGLILLSLMLLGEIIFGGVGSGLYGMLVFAIIAVFVAGLMVGRTPEYLGKKIEAFEMKMASLVILIPPAVVLIGLAVAVSLPAGTSSVFNPGAHGFSEMLYAFASAGNNNGSAFAGLNGNTPFYNLTLGLAMFAARYWLIIPTLAMAGSLAAKKHVPAGAGTLPTHTPLFIALLIAIILIVGGLTFIPALALGPIVEQLLLAS